MTAKGEISSPFVTEGHGGFIKLGGVYGAQRYIKDGVPELTNVFKSILRRLIVLKLELLSCEYMLFL